jgi:hypothetical protein
MAFEFELYNDVTIDALAKVGTVKARSDYAGDSENSYYIELVDPAENANGNKKWYGESELNPYCAAVETGPHLNPDYLTATIGEPYYDEVQLAGSGPFTRTVNSSPEWIAEDTGIVIDNENKKLIIQSDGPENADTEELDVTINNGCGSARITYEIESTEP